MDFAKSQLMFIIILFGFYWVHGPSFSSPNRRLTSSVNNYVLTSEQAVLLLCFEN